MSAFGDDGRAVDEQTAGRMSLHRRILSDITDRIVGGTWPPGHRIPFEVELAAEYGCSRMTVNKALSQLAKAGLIERRRRSGSFVRRPRSQAAILEIHDIRAEVEALGLAYAFAVRRQVRRATTAQDRERLGSGTVRRVAEIETLHGAGGRPFCLERRLISIDAVPDAERQDFSAVSPGPWLISHVPWSMAEHRISAAAATASTAALLGIAPGTACLVVDRRTWTADVPVTSVTITYPGEAHALVARFTPERD